LTLNGPPSGMHECYARNQCESRCQDAYSLTMKKEAIYSSETLADFQQTIRRYVPEDSTLQQRLISRDPISAGERDIPLLQSIKTTSGGHPPSYTLDTGPFSLGVKHLVCEADH
jgi:hypothetical protein